MRTINPVASQIIFLRETIFRRKSAAPNVQCAKPIISARDRAIEIRSQVRMRTRTRTGSGRGMSREEKSSQASSAVLKPSPDPFYTLRPHAGDVTAVQYLDLGTSGGIASGYATHYRVFYYGTSINYR